MRIPHGLLTNLLSETGGVDEGFVITFLFPSPTGKVGLPDHVLLFPLPLGEG